MILVHLEYHEPWSKASLSALSSIGTVQLGELHSSHLLPLYSSCCCLLLSFRCLHRRRLLRSDDFFLWSTGLMYFLTYFVNNAFRRYPDYAKIALYTAAGVYSGSLLLSSFATEVSQGFLWALSLATCADTRCFCSRFGISSYSRVYLLVLLDRYSTRHVYSGSQIGFTQKGELHRESSSQCVFSR